MAAPQVLKQFPLEIWHLIIQEVRLLRDQGNFKRLRLVCKFINALVEPIVFERLALCFDDNEYRRTHAIIDILSSLASGGSPFIRWATRLHLIVNRSLPYSPSPSPEGVDDRSAPYPDAAAGHGVGDTYLDDVSLQLRSLLPAIESLMNLKWVCWDLSDKTEPYRAILPALARLPNLQSLTFYTDDLGPNRLDFAAFSNLSEIIFTQLPLDETTVQEVGRMVANCPSLTSLLLYVSGIDGIHEQAFHFSDFTRQALELPSFQPSLRDLRVLSGRHIIMTSACIPFLGSLSRLELATGHIEEPGFWSGLTGAGIRLRALRVNRLALSIVRYLTTYEGLEEFMFDHTIVGINHPCGLSTEDEVQIFYDTILPKHCTTLRTLGLACADPIAHISGFDVIQTQEWYISQEKLERITTCTALKHLEIMHYHFDPRHSTPSWRRPYFPLSVLLSIIASRLPQLHEVKLLLDCAPHRDGAPYCLNTGGHGWKPPNALADQACLSSLCTTAFNTALHPTQNQLEPQFRVKAAWKVLRPRCVYASPNDRRFHLEIEGDDPHDYKTRTRSCTKCEEPWTSYYMAGSHDWESLL
ncbi:hypothetical protein NMY22_g6324 [Coprinellus aureogranulatus]|nr:hypothetical protein NMY22_g6324 [Coprinellus aureogranulatus]